MSDADGATVDVDLARVKAEFAYVCQGNDTERLVDFPQCNVFYAETRLLQRPRYCQRRRHRKVDRTRCCIRKRCEHQKFT